MTGQWPCLALATKSYALRLMAEGSNEAIIQGLDRQTEEIDRLLSQS